MKIHKEVKQRSEEWFDLRKGKMTASNAQAIAANGKGLETYIYSLMAEKYSNNMEIYTNNDMERGIELEESARMTYEIEREQVEEVGFVEMNEFIGCSPDGLVGKHGGLEIKCVNDVNFFKLLVNGEKAIDAKYLWQVKMCMFVTERDWWDLAFYDPNFNKNMLIYRIELDMASREKLIIGTEKGKVIIKEILKKYEQSNGV